MVVELDSRRNVHDDDVQLVLHALLDTVCHAGQIVELVALGHEGDDAYQRGVGVRKHVAGERRLLLGREARVLQRSVEICVAADGGDDLLRLVAEAQYAFRTALILHCFEKQRSVRGDLLFYDKAISCH